MAERNSLEKKIFPFMAGVVIGAGIAAIEYHNPHRRFDRDPKAIRDYLLWGLLRPIMVTMADGKVTHFWHWRKIPLDSNLEGVLLPGNPEAFQRKNAMDKVRMSLGGWKNVHRLRPVNEDGTPYFGRYKVSYKVPNINDLAEECSIILRGPKPIRMLQGDGDVLIYPRGLDGRVKFSNEGVHSRKDPSIGEPII